MDSAEITYFQSAEGRGLLEKVAEVGGDALKAQGLRRDHAVERVRAALALYELRDRARAKFARADGMFFDRDGLEQASGDVIARHRAKRYAGAATVGDLCCGVGGDSAALAAVTEVTSVDIRPERVAMARANVSVNGGSGRFACADVQAWRPQADAVFVDPSRRESGRRVTRLAAYAPPVDDLSWLEAPGGTGIKVAPGIDHADLPPGCEAEFISVDGECREAVIWLGDLRSHAGVRATLLPGGDSLTNGPVDAVPCGPVDAYVFEPDRAVIRAHLVEQVAASIGAVKLAPDVAYLTGGNLTDSPFVKAYGVDAVLPFSLKRVQDYVSANNIGRLEIKRRRFPMTPEAVRGKLRLKGSAEATLILTRVDEAATAIFGRPVQTR